MEIKSETRKYRIRHFDHSISSGSELSSHFLETLDSGLLFQEVKEHISYLILYLRHLLVITVLVTVKILLLYLKCRCVKQVLFSRRSLTVLSLFGIMCVK